MAGLTQEVKVFIVTRLACFDGVQEVMKAVREEFKLDVSRQQVQFYDPTSKAGERLGDKMKELFHEQRKRFLEDTSAIPIANKAVRLRMLQRLADDAASKKNAALTASLLEQAAKEVGDSFSNRQKVDHTGVVGHAAVPAPKNPPAGLTPEDAYKAMLGHGANR